MSQSPGQDSRVAFPTTSWSLLCQAQKAGGAKRAELIQKVLTSYWKPVYAYFRAQGKPREDAEDLVQGFLNRFAISDSVLMSAKPGQRFRSLIRVCARNFLIDEERHKNAKRRTPKEGLISFAALQAEDGDPFEPPDSHSADAFDEIWRREILDRAMQRLQTACREKQREDDLQIFLTYYLPATDTSPTWEELADQYGFSDWQQAARKAHWVREQLARAIRAEVGSYVEDENEIDAEIASLLG
ncbi:MAG: sigma-70 family RNA polymerase sigma factor [Planctomycetota bacterium]|nr:sigma-70 family RNA polymerase sigma factor [Planctomycetota bacterium]